MRIVFMGTPDFSVPSLEALLAAGHEVAAVFTQPDRPKGRGNRLQPPPAKVCAAKHGIPVFQPEKIRTEAETLRSLAPDVCVTAAFGQFLTQEILDIPRLGTVNVHGSLLPRHRGSAPIAWAMAMGEREIGVTTMMTVKKMDAGDMLLRRSVERGEEETCGELTARLAAVGAELLVETLAQMEAGTLPRTPQNEDEMTYEPMLSRELSAVDWTMDARRIADRILAFNPWPACSVPWQDGRLKLLRARVAEGSGEPGEVIAADPANGLVVACGSGAVCVTELQAPGGRAMRAADYLRGHPMEKGTRLTEERECHE